MASHKTRTVQVRRRRRSRFLPGEVSMAQLKRDIERGVSHFFRQRPNLHQPGTDAAGFDFHQRRTA